MRLAVKSAEPRPSSSTLHSITSGAVIWPVSTTVPISVTSSMRDRVVLERAPPAPASRAGIVGGTEDRGQLLALVDQTHAHRDRLGQHLMLDDGLPQPLIGSTSAVTSFLDLDGLLLVALLLPRLGRRGALGETLAQFGLGVGRGAAVLVALSRRRTWRAPRGTSPTCRRSSCRASAGLRGLCAPIAGSLTRKSKNTTERSRRPAPSGPAAAVLTRLAREPWDENPDGPMTIEVTPARGDLAPGLAEQRTLGQRGQVGTRVDAVGAVGAEEAAGVDQARGQVGIGTGVDDAGTGRPGHAAPGGDHLAILQQDLDATGQRRASPVHSVPPRTTTGAAPGWPEPPPLRAASLRRGAGVALRS